MRFSWTVVRPVWTHVSVDSCPPRVHASHADYEALLAHTLLVMAAKATHPVSMFLKFVSSMMAVSATTLACAGYNYLVDLVGVGVCMVQLSR